jgi:DNA-binding transcriptional LysR family regulator
MNTLFFNILFFKYAIEIERTRSITKAAENLYMAQPNLSKAVKEMEETVGFAIFERNSRGVVPTQKGLRFLDYARKILEEMVAGGGSMKKFGFLDKTVAYLIA